MKILVVDDNRETADALAAFLSMHGHETVALYRGREVFERVQSFAPDCVLLDLRMPDLDGFSIARTLRDSVATRHLRMIALTGERAESLLGEIQDDLFEHYFLKPASPLAILAHIDGLPNVYTASGSPFAPLAVHAL